MLSLSEIKKYYPEKLQAFPRFLLREYLQYKILEILYESEYASALTFMGGTCLRLVHENRRFSEYLDFDNKALSEDDFSKVSNLIANNLRAQGYQVEMRLVLKNAWHCHIKIPNLLFNENLSGYQEEKILIQIDTLPQNLEYEPSQFLMNRFDVFTRILTTPLPILFAQKIYAILNRPRSKGRDYYDIVFLMGKSVKPNLAYLKAKTGISNSQDLKSVLLDHCEKSDLKKLSEDVSPFLFDLEETKKVLRFEDAVRSYGF